MKPLIWLLVFSAVSCLVGCGRASNNVTGTPSPMTEDKKRCFDQIHAVEVPCDPLERALKVEMSDHQEDSLPRRLEARQSVLDYLKSEHPKWQLNGMSLTRYDNDPGYYVGVDVTDEGKSKLVQLKVWYLVKSDGETYWKVGAP